MSTKPDELNARALDVIMTGVQARGGAGCDGVGGQVFLALLTEVSHGRHPPEKCGTRTATDLRLVAERLDALRAGDRTQVADLVAAPCAALEVSVIDGTWETPQPPFRGGDMTRNQLLALR